MKTRRNKLPPRPVQALLGGLFLTLASQVSISLFQSDFRISAAVMLLPLFVFLAPGCPVFYTALVGGAGTVLLRAALHGQQGTFAAAVAAYAPEFLFFALYGALLAGYLRLVKLRPFRWRVMLPVVCIDFASNLVELAVRLGTGVLNWRVLAGIFAAALCRTLFTAVMLWALDAYGVAILRREDSERYRRLLLMTSSLEGERVLLRRNAEMVEAAMREAYGLYDALSADKARTGEAQKALGVAKDIHELKKEYLLILRGIEDTLGTEAGRDGMYLSELWNALQPGLVRAARDAGKQVALRLVVEEDIYTVRHYALMSVFRNLLGNALEAAGSGPVEIVLEQSGAAPVRFAVRDNCGGIAPKYLDKVFRPGFSTKMDGAGEINRGLGLAVVRDIAEELGGSVSVESGGGKTCFTVELPRERLVAP